MKSSKILILFFFVGLANLSVAQKIEKATIVVAADGSGQYTSIQQAINSVADHQKARTVIFVRNGSYTTEKLIVPTEKTNLTIRGESREHTKISYHMYDCKSPASGNKCPTDDYERWKDNKELIRTSATLTVMAEGFIAENLTVANTAGPVGQALAVTLRADKVAFINCELLGYQDTVFIAKDGTRNYFYRCLVLGRTDYIYGGGIGYFDKCEIKSYGGGWITAPSTPEKQQYGFVFNNCNFTFATGSPKKTDDNARVAIGRPWHNYPKVAVLNSRLCGQMHPAGWPTTWNMAYAATSDGLHLYEFNNTGKGADMSQRAKWAGIRALDSNEAKSYGKAAVLGDWELKF